MPIAFADPLAAHAVVRAVFGDRFESLDAFRTGISANQLVLQLTLHNEIDCTITSAGLLLKRYIDYWPYAGFPHRAGARRSIQRIATLAYVLALQA